MRRYESGGGRLVSTANDYARFLQMLINGGSLDGRRYLGPRTISLLTADHSHAGAGIVPGPLYLPGPGYGFGLGFAVRLTDDGSTIPGRAGEYNWSGYGGTTFWVDPQEGLIAILMTQGPNQRTHTRTLFRKQVYGALAP